MVISIGCMLWEKQVLSLLGVYAYNIHNEKFCQSI